MDLSAIKEGEFILAGDGAAPQDAANSRSKWNTTFLPRHWVEVAIVKLTKTSCLKQQAACEIPPWAELWFLNTFCPQVVQCFLHIISCQ